MLDFALDLISWWRPSRYRGVGIRGGFVLGILWAVVAAAASVLGWDPIYLALALAVSAAVGYRLERFGGAVAVAIFSAGFWWLPLFYGWEWPPAAGCGFVLGLVYGAATTERHERGESDPQGSRDPVSDRRPSASH